MSHCLNEYSNVIYYASKKYPHTEDKISDLRQIFKAEPWCNSETDFNSIIWHLLNTWKLVRGGQEVGYQELDTILTEDLNPESIKNGFGEPLAYHELLVQTILSKIAITKKIDDHGKRKYPLDPIDENLLKLMETRQVVSETSNVVMLGR